MAPGCELESFVSFSMASQWHEILFETGNRARKALESQGLNYFLINLNAVLTDIIQYSPLLRWENIESNLQVAWSDRDVYLLTWPGPNTTPIPPEFMARYCRDYFTSATDFQPLYDRVNVIYQANRTRSFPIYRDPALAPVRGWQ
jgi:hypothetical protein